MMPLSDFKNYSSVPGVLADVRPSGEVSAFSTPAQSDTTLTETNLPTCDRTGELQDTCRPLKYFFSNESAARFLGVCPETVYRLTDACAIEPLVFESDFRQRRIWTRPMLEEMQARRQTVRKDRERGGINQARYTLD
jgi:hypothetical protein